MESDNQVTGLDELSLALVCHELRGPLGLVVTAARTASSDAEDEFLRRQCQVIERTAERLLRVSMAILSMATQPPYRGQFELSPVLQNTLEDLRGLGLPIELSWQASASLRARGSREDFEGLLTSLVMNAADHGAPGTSIWVSVAASTEVITVVLRNEKASERTHRGYGLGTIIAHKLADRVGADLLTETRGSVFVTTIRLPRTDRERMRGGASETDPLLAVEAGWNPF